MDTDFPYLVVADELKKLVGEPDEGTRMYRKEGSDDEVGAWFDALARSFPGEQFVSPGGVSMYVEVSRAGTHKRMKEGRLTAFLFHVVRQERNLFGYQKKLKQRPYIYIPVSECKAWGAELKASPWRKQSESQGDGDFDGRFLDKDPKDKGKRGVKYVSEASALQILGVFLPHHSKRRNNGPK